MEINIPPYSVFIVLQVVFEQRISRFVSNSLTKPENASFSYLRRKYIFATEISCNIAFSVNQNVLTYNRCRFEIIRWCEIRR